VFVEAHAPNLTGPNLTGPKLIGPKLIGQTARFGLWSAQLQSGGGAKSAGGPAPRRASPTPDLLDEDILSAGK